MSPINIACVASDVGPAQYILALQDNLDGDIRWACSELVSPWVRQRGHQVVPVDQAVRGADVLVVGTSIGRTIDKSSMAMARAMHVPSVAVIDHWTWYRERFLIGTHLELPDHIFLNDHWALEDAEIAGLPRHRLESLGNPVLEKMALQSKVIAAARSQPARSDAIVFVSEALAGDTLFRGSRQLRYSEFEVLEAILHWRGTDDQVIVKLHPTESAEKFSSLGSRIRVVSGVSAVELAQMGRIVVGLGSMMLLELAALGCRVFHVEMFADEDFIGGRLGATTAVKELSELGKAMSSPNPRLPEFAEAFLGSTKRISTRIEGIASS